MSATINGKELLSLLPHRYGYATKIVERLRTKGVHVTLRCIKFDGHEFVP